MRVSDARHAPARLLLTRDSNEMDQLAADLDNWWKDDFELDDPVFPVVQELGSSACTSPAIILDNDGEGPAGRHFAWKARSLDEEINLNLQSRL